MIAGSLDVGALLRGLATRRPVFHSEADFQRAFAWQAHCDDARLRVRLETHPAPGMRLDLLLSRTDLDRHTAVELKYLTAGWTGHVGDEHFELKNQGAQDVRAYDVVKDICRLEKFVDGRPSWNGIFIAITNEPSFWRPVTHGRATNADEFRIYEGVSLSGVRRWGPHTGAGTMNARENAIELRGIYPLSWQDYARVDNGPRGLFRMLAVEVANDLD